MDHQLQQLAGLGLELQRLDMRVHVIPFDNATFGCADARADHTQRRWREDS